MGAPGYTDQTLSPNIYVFSAGTIPSNAGALSTLYSLLSAADAATVDALTQPILEVHIVSPTVAFNFNHSGSTTVYWPQAANTERSWPTIGALKKIYVRSNTAATITDAILMVYA